MIPNKVLRSLIENCESTIKSQEKTDKEKLNEIYGLMANARTHLQNA